MRESKINDVNMLISAGNYNFLAFAFTPWHAHGVCAVIDKLTSENKELKCLICVCKHRTSSYVIDETYFKSRITPKNVLFIDVNSNAIDGRKDKIFNYIKTVFKSVKKTADAFYFVMPNQLDLMRYSEIRRYASNSNVICYVVDEGLATYMRKPEEFYETLQDGASFANRLWIYVRIKFLDRILESRLTKNNMLVDFHLLKREDGNLVRNIASLEFYKNAIRSEDVINGTESSFYKNAVIINTQPFKEEGSIDGDEDLRILTSVSKALIERGDKVVLKPHPREEMLDRYNNLNKKIHIDSRKGISQEAIIASLEEKPKAVIGFSSTTLVSLKLFYDIPTISLAKMWNKAGISEKLILEQQRFIETFEYVVDCPENVGEVLNLIQ